MRVVGEVVCLARLGVCEEEEIDAAVFLLLLARSDSPGSGRTYSGGEAHAPADNVARLGLLGRHHAKLAPLHEACEGCDFLLQAGRVVLVGELVGVGGLVADVCVGVFGRHFVVGCRLDFVL